MTNDDWSLLKRVFEEALTRGAEGRAAWLEEACAGRPEVRAEVQSLLAAQDEAGDFLERPALADVPPGWEPGGTNGSWIGRRLGPYRLVADVGRGGMGAVFLAERDDDQFRKQVAIKIIGTGATSPEMLRRFLAERQILATLEHPNIARLLDGGIAAGDMPYMVMEYIHGLPITEHCEKNRLGIRERLELFRTVCRAVHFAHQHLVVHRDLKPGNILVTADGTPVLLDFGIAKILDPLTPRGATTRLFRPFTPGYASPEQLRGAPATTATDVYSLGVILYELLAGSPPYQLEELPPDEALRLVEIPPQKPSARRPDGRLPFADDLDLVTLKAMRKEPAERYGSAQELADDVTRYLEGMPVLARRGSLRYVLRKLVARHKVAVAALATGAVLVATGVTAVGWEAHVANRERAQSQHRFNELRGLASFMIFDLHDEIARLPGSTEVRKKLVVHALEYLDSLARESAGDARLQSELAAAYISLGDVQGRPSAPNLGDPAGAQASYGKALGLAGRASALQPGNDSGMRQQAFVFLRLGELQGYAGSPRDARDNVQRALHILQARAGRAGAVAGARADLATAYLTMFLLIRPNDREGSRPYLNQAATLYERHLSEQPADDAAMNNVALANRYLATFSGPEASLTYLRRSLELDERRAARTPSAAAPRLDVSTDLSEIGNRLLNLGRNAEALKCFRRSLVIRQDLAAADPRNVLAQTRLGYSLLAVGRALFALNDFAGAAASLRKSAAVYAGYTAANPSDWLARVWLLADYARLGEAEIRLGHRGPGCDAFRRGSATWASLPAKARDVWTDDHGRISRGLAACSGN